MKIKANQVLYKKIMIAFASLIILIGSFGYFLGFNINTISLLFYVGFLVSTIILFIVVFLIIDIKNNKYIVFDKEKILEKNKDDEKILVYYNQIVEYQYHNSIDLLNCVIEFGYVEIGYRFDSKDRETKKICIYLSKKNYELLFT